MATQVSPAAADARFGHPSYLIRKKIFSLFGQQFHIFDPAGNLVFYSKLKAFKLKEDIRVYTGEDMTTEVLTIKARNIIDFSVTFDVVDARTGEKVGALRRKGFKSLLKDEWLLLDANDQEIGALQEDNMVMSLIRRLVPVPFISIPQHFTGSVQGTPVCEFRQNFNPFVLKLTADFSQDGAGKLDRRLGIAAGILLGAIEGRQE